MDTPRNSKIRKHKLSEPVVLYRFEGLATFSFRSLVTNRRERAFHLYLYAKRFANASMAVLVLGLMTMAITKATLVGMYFMHLKFEGKWVYAMLVPAGILAMVLTFALFPDVAMQPVTEENPDTQDMKTAPVQPGPVATISVPPAILG